MVGIRLEIPVVVLDENFWGHWFYNVKIGNLQIGGVQAFYRQHNALREAIECLKELPEYDGGVYKMKIIESFRRPVVMKTFFQEQCADWELVQNERPR